ncbi:MAG: hypothetical protein IJX99_09100 [Clostridia bacterium]|nr:hypothetical protein [Clostridia bacterium]
MDKKQMVIVSVIAAIVVALVVGVVVVSDTTPRLTKQEVLKVDNNIYTVEELEKFMYISKEADGDIEKALTEEEMETIYGEFIQSKVYAAAADSKKISFPSGEVASAQSKYDSKASVFEAHGITSGDYMRYAEDNYKMTTLMNNISTYYELPEDIYNEFKNSYSGDDLKSYSFRTMRFYYEVPASGESGDVEPKVNESGEIVEDRRKESVRAKAEAALAAVNNSGDFEKIAEEQADGRYTINNNGLVYLNGNLEYAIAPILESKLGSKDLYEKVKALNVGEVTEMVDDTEGTSFIFTKLESVEDGFVGEADKEVREQLISEVQETIILKDVSYQENMSALIQFLYK